MNFWFVGRLLLPINRDRNDKSGNEGESNFPRKNDQKTTPLEFSLKFKSGSP